MKKLCFTLVVAAVLWAVMFSPQTMPLINFWEKKYIQKFSVRTIAL